MSVFLFFAALSLTMADDGKSMLGSNSILGRPLNSIYNSIGRVLLNVEYKLEYTDKFGDRQRHLFDEWKSKLFSGTGVLLTPCLVATNQHVIQASTNESRFIVNEKFRELNADPSNTKFEFFIHQKNLRFRVGSNPTKVFADEIQGKVVLVGDHPEPYTAFKSTQSIWAFAQHNDWAFIKLDRPVAGNFKFFIPKAVTEKSLKSCHKIVMAGFPGAASENDRNLRSPTNCQVVGDYGDYSFFLDCINESGASGSPILCFDSETDSDPDFIGLASAVDNYGPNGESWTYVVNFNFPEFLEGIEELGKCGS